MGKAWIRTLIGLRTLLRDRQGASLVEYALIVAVAILVVVVAIGNFSDAFIEATNFVSKELKDAVSGS